MNDLSSAMQRVDAFGVASGFVAPEEDIAAKTIRRAGTAAHAAVKDEVDTIAALLAERAKQHGEFNDYARITQNLKGMMIDPAGKSNWFNLTAAHKEALEMIAHKIGRILAGNPNHRDHWDDISGYARLAADRIGEG